MDSAQITGSCSSYSRKYALSSLCCIDNSEVDVEVDDTDERQQKANDMMDAAQSMMNDIVDDLQGKVDDMEVANG